MRSKKKKLKHKAKEKLRREWQELKGVRHPKHFFFAIPSDARVVGFQKFAEGS